MNESECTPQRDTAIWPEQMIRWLHPAFSLVAGGFIVWVVVRGLHRRETRALGMLVLTLLGVQYLLGVADVALLAPTWLQMTHLLGADLLWIGLILLSARLCVVPAETAVSPVPG